MYPVHKEKYFVNKETFYNFTYDRHADIFKKEKNVNIIYGLGMFVAAIVTTIINFMSQSAKTDFVWMVLPFAFIFLTLSFVLKYRRYDNHVATKILTDYKNKNYENKQISLKFYEDKVEYSFGEMKEEIQYSSFKKFYEGPAYFALYFHTGDLILMSDKQNVAKIKGIIDEYKANFAKKAAEAEA